MHSKRGFTPSSTSLSPPTMIESRASFAPTSPPETGASRAWAPFAFAVAKISRARTGWLVVISIKTVGRPPLIVWFRETARHMAHAVPRLRAPIVLAHGLMGYDRLCFADYPVKDYFSGIGTRLGQAGNRILRARLSPTGGVLKRAGQLH